MDLSDTIELTDAKDRPADAPVADQAPARAHPQCDHCGSAVDAAQRYCVVCGAHLKTANDPAARYFGRAARSRSVTAAQRPVSRAARGRGLASALVLALIPVAAAIGVLAGRSSNNNDAKLIQALAHRQPTVTVSGSATPGGATVAGTAGSVTRSHAKTGSAKAHAATSSTKKHATAATSNTASSTGNGAVQQITGSKPTKSQEQQGAQATQKVQKSTGKSYVNSQNSLPGQVVVP